MSLHAYEPNTIERYATAGGTMNSRDHIEYGCLTCAIGTDKPQKVMRLNFHTEVGDGRQTSEILSAVIYVKKRHDPTRILSAGSNPQESSVWGAASFFIT